MTTSIGAFRSAYAARLSAHLADPGEVGLHEAYELGREAVAGELGVLDVTAAHHDVLLEACRADDRADVQAVLGAAGDFLLEVLSVYHVLGRGLDEARAAALAERRSSDMLRRLSRLLADPSLAHETHSLDEALHLVAEEASELTGASASIVTARLAEDRTVTATAGAAPAWVTAPRSLATRRLLVAPGLHAVRMSRRDVIERHDLGADAGVAWLAAPLRYLNGGEFGLVEVFSPDDFSELDEAMLVHLAEISAAALERASLYRVHTNVSQDETDAFHPVWPGNPSTRQGPEEP
jgi:phosphoserine phosphatase RsbU-like protein/GAF domain-containing protein